MENYTKALFIAIFIVISIVLILITLYFIPSIIAIKKRHKDLSKILMINTFLGWTIVGWIISLVIVINKQKKE
ncbi:MAG TPA: superinfection immunity protein [Clostridiales bacterium]|nr:superinfection immunity protein [Clostridiales bacterium]